MLYNKIISIYTELSEKDFNPDKFQKLLNVKRETYNNKLRNL